MPSNLSNDKLRPVCACPPALSRWFQFRLTTWFLVVGFAAWAFAIAPWYKPSTVVLLKRPGTTAPIQVAEVFESSAPQDRERFYEWVRSEEYKSGVAWVEFRNTAETRFKALIFAIIVVLACKAAWLLFERRRKAAVSCPAQNLGA